MRLLLERLEARASAGRPVTVALAGAGRFGTSIAAQIAQIDGLRLAAVADPNAHNGADALRAAGWADDQWQQCENAAAAEAAVSAGGAALTPDADALASAPIEVFVDATGVPDVAARNAREALRQGRHVVMVTVEADVSCGWALAREARRQGVVYTLAAGDQPIAIMELFDWAAALGLEPVAVGRGTRLYPADRHGDPDQALERLGYGADTANRLRLNAQMYNSFRDGTKSQIEMCAVSNMTGLPPDRRGMHEPSAGLDDCRICLRRSTPAVCCSTPASSTWPTPWRPTARPICRDTSPPAYGRSSLPRMSACARSCAFTARASRATAGARCCFANTTCAAWRRR